MTDDGALPPAGWYPEPPGSNDLRYWDGRAWSDARSPTGQRQPGPYTADQTGAYGVAPMAPIIQPRPMIEQPPLAAGARVNTPFIWVLVLLPLLSLAATLVYSPGANLQYSIDHPTTGALHQFTDPGYLLTQGLGFLIYGASVVLAFLDWRALQRMGVVRPFHWAWQFLSPVYIIGRTVVLRRRVRQGMAPLWIYIAVYFVTIVVVVIELVQIFSTLSSQLATVGTSA